MSVIIIMISIALLLSLSFGLALPDYGSGSTLLAHIVTEACRSL